MSEFYNGILENLKQEANHLNTKLEKLRDNHDMNGYISTLKSLKETLDLIKKYDWQLMYSEYGVKDEEKISKINDELAIATASGELKDRLKYLLDKSNVEPITEIAVWEQNHEGQIRNHKTWTTNIPYKKDFNLNKIELPNIKS